MSEESSMKCDVNTWHYKLIFFVFQHYHWTPVPRNFCPYMRKLVVSATVLPLVLLWRKLPESIRNYQDIAITLFSYFVIVHTVYALIFVLSGGIYMEREWEDGSIINETAKQLEWWWGTAFYLGSIAVVGAIIGLVIIICDYLDERKRKQREQGVYNSKNKSVSLFKSYIHSKHNKICPVMEFYDSNKDEGEKK